VITSKNQKNSIKIQISTPVNRYSAILCGKPRNGKLYITAKNRRRNDIMPDLKFGTSGLRGLVTDLTGSTCQRYMAGFLKHMAAAHGLKPGSTVLVGYDLRASSPHIARTIMEATLAAGYQAENCGALPTPALALAARTRRACAVMVTGSHIPEDRNGLKFYRVDGEIDKADEAGILHHLAETVENADNPVMPQTSSSALEAYSVRALSVLPAQTLTGLRIGVYQHSSVARDLLPDILGRLGAEVITVERAHHFIAVDTEALSDENRKIAVDTVKTHRLDALVSTDGDADRPLIADENGVFMQGDIIGLLTAHFLRADAVVTPVTSTSIIETCGFFKRVYRCCVGSPYVIESMQAAKTDGYTAIVGFEANGGVLLGSSTALEKGVLPALPTRDAVLPILSILGLIQQRNIPVSALRDILPRRYTANGRLKNIPSGVTMLFLNRLADTAGRSYFFKPLGSITHWNMTDGLRVELDNTDIIHFRASGNAPELRCYSEAANQQRANVILKWGLQQAALFARQQYTQQ